MKYILPELLIDKSFGLLNLFPLNLSTIVLNFGLLLFIFFTYDILLSLTWHKTIFLFLSNANPLDPLITSDANGACPVEPLGVIYSLIPLLSDQVKILFCLTSLNINWLFSESHKGPSVAINDSPKTSILEFLSISSSAEFLIMVTSWSVSYTHLTLPTKA